MMEIVDNLIGVGFMLVIGTIACNFMIHTIRPNMSRKRHIFVSSMLPAFAFWLLVSIVLTATILPETGGSLEYFLALIMVTIFFPFLGALFGIPTSLFILKQTGWKDSESLDDVFK